MVPFPGNRGWAQSRHEESRFETPGISDPSQIGPYARDLALERLDSDQFDIIVIGGGVTGAGTALDAASRGMSVALVEQGDLGSGTSSRSSRLFHGGLRYLEQFELGLVREALAERNLMLTRLSPHLVKGVPFIYPLTRRGWERLYLGAGVLLYDWLARAARSPLPRHRHLTRDQTMESVPALDQSRLVGAIQYWDAQVDDARHTMTVARTAARHGAVIATYTRVEGLWVENGRLVGVTCVDLETGRRMQVRGRQVINATGVWSGLIQQLCGDRPLLEVQPSKGVHLVVPRSTIASHSGLITRAHGSVLLMIPWGDFWIIGTTDDPWLLDHNHPVANRTDLDRLLNAINRWLVRPLALDDIVGVYAGLRPLVAGDKITTRLSRRHQVVRSEAGLISIAGGKYTTYRLMARDAVDAALIGLGMPSRPSVTAELPLVGADGYESILGNRSNLVSRAPVAAEDVDRLLGRYGDRIEEVLGLIRHDMTLGRSLVGGPPYLAAEVVYATTHEGARHIDDVLTRRTRVSVETADGGAAAAIDVARLMAPQLGWSEARSKAEVESFVTRAMSERRARQEPDDRTATEVLRRSDLV